MMTFCSTVQQCLSHQEHDYPQTVKVGGWVQTLRRSKKVSFLTIADGSCLSSLQIVCTADFIKDHPDIAQLTPGCAVVIEGSLVPSLGSGQQVELLATSVEFVSKVEDPDYLNRERERQHYLETVEKLTFWRVFHSDFKNRREEMVEQLKEALRQAGVERFE